MSCQNAGEHSPEFKRETVRLIRTPSVTVARIAQGLGIGANILSRWRREQIAAGENAFQKHGNARDEEMAPAQAQADPGEEGAGFCNISGSVLRKCIEIRYRMTERCRDAFPIRLVCRDLSASPGTCYDWRDRPLSARARNNQHLLGRIRPLHDEDSD